MRYAKHVKLSIYALEAMTIAITPSPSKRGVGVMGREPGPGLNPRKEGM